VRQPGHGHPVANGLVPITRWSSSMPVSAQNLWEARTAITVIISRKAAYCTRPSGSSGMSSIPSKVPIVPPPFARDFPLTFAGRNPR
jgi:hypothetical protein